MDAAHTDRARQLGLALSLGRQLTVLTAALHSKSGELTPETGRCSPSFAEGDETGPLAATAQAVRFFRKAARQEPAHYLPDLAVALRDHAAQLAGAGRDEEALTTTQDAVAVLQHVAKHDPAALPTLADGLHDLATRLTARSRGHDAVTALEDAVALRRHLANRHPARFLPALAASLDELGQGLGAGGDETEALATLNEAVAVRRLLADGDGRHLPDLAASLQALSVGLATTGQLPEALRVGRETAMLFEHLADADGLAGAVENIAISLAAMHLPDASRTASEHAAALRQARPLAGCCCPCHTTAPPPPIVDTVAVTGPIPVIPTPEIETPGAL